jgi:uncharacterized protein YbjT (DUF2867 family)
MVRVPDADVQPIAGVEAAQLVAAIATDQPANATVEIAGGEALAFQDAVGRVLAARNDRRRVVADSAAPYFGATVRDGVLLPGPNARTAHIGLADWLAEQPNGAAFVHGDPHNFNHAN